MKTLCKTVKPVSHMTCVIDGGDWTGGGCHHHTVSERENVGRGGDGGGDRVSVCMSEWNRVMSE